MFPGRRAIRRPSTSTSDRVITIIHNFIHRLWMKFNCGLRLESHSA
jgi:hypothetical protein